MPRDQSSAPGLPTVVVIDDEPGIVDFVELGLGHEGLNVVSAADAATGLEIVRSVRPQLVILDVGLPDFPLVEHLHGRLARAMARARPLAFAEDGASFGTPGVRIGLFCSTPMVAVSRAIGRKRALEMLLGGRPIDAHTAADWGAWFWA